MLSNSSANAWQLWRLRSPGLASRGHPPPTHKYSGVYERDSNASRGKPPASSLRNVLPKPLTSLDSWLDDCANLDLGLCVTRCNWPGGRNFLPTGHEFVVNGWPETGWDSRHRQAGDHVLSLPSLAVFDLVGPSGKTTARLLSGSSCRVRSVLPTSYHGATSLAATPGET